MIFLNAHRRNLSVLCDTWGCGRTFLPNYRMRNRDNARARAARSGWCSNKVSGVGVVDVCPDCRAKEEMPAR